MINTRHAIVLSGIAATATLAISLILYGTAADGALVAARNTARMSSIMFSLALAMRSRAALGASLMYGFVAAHVVHYASVVYLASVAIHHFLQDPTLGTVVFVTYGVLLVAVIAITTKSRGAWLRRLNAIIIYIAWLTLAGGAAINGRQHWPSVIPGALLLAAMGYHLRTMAAQRRPASVAAASS